MYSFAWTLYQMRIGEEAIHNPRGTICRTLILSLSSMMDVTTKQLRPAHGQQRINALKSYNVQALRFSSKCLPQLSNASLKILHIPRWTNGSLAHPVSETTMKRDHVRRRALSPSRVTSNISYPPKYVYWNTRSNNPSKWTTTSGSSCTQWGGQLLLAFEHAMKSKQSGRAKRIDSEWQDF